MITPLSIFRNFLQTLKVFMGLCLVLLATASVYVVSTDFTETRADLRKRAIFDFSKRYDCDQQDVYEIFPQEFQCRCSRDTNCGNAWVLVGCGKQDVYTIGHRVFTDWNTSMSHTPYVAPVQIEF